jgi:hypothetical protein
MFEKQLKNIFNEISEKVQFKGKYVSVSELSSSEIGSEYINFINADVNYLIYKDKLERLANSYFDFSNSEFREKIDELDKYYRDNAKYSKSQFLDILKSAIEIRLNILIRPLHSFVWFVYKNELTKPLNEIFLKLDYISDYSYITDRIKQDLTEEHKGKPDSLLISFAEFKHRIVNIELEHINKSEIDVLLEDLNAMFEFFDDKNEKGEPAIPVEALIIFIDDKGFKPLAGFLEKKYMQIPDAKLTKEEIKNIFSKLEESYNKYQDDDILNSAVNGGFQEQINDFGDEEIAGRSIDEDFETENQKAIEEVQEQTKENIVDLNDTDFEENNNLENDDNNNSGKSFKEMMREYLEEYEIH